jgi:hypothetical protein
VGTAVAVSFTVTVDAPGAGTPSGDVTVTAAGGAETCSAAVGAGGCSITLTATGSRELTATYEGDAAFAGSSDTEPHEVVLASSTTTISSDLPEPSITGESVDVAVTVTSGGGTPTGTVEVEDGLGGSCVATLVGGAGSCAIAPAAAGTLTLDASYSGDALRAASEDTEPHQVDQAPTTLALLAADPSPAIVGRLVVLSFALDVPPPGGGSPTGTVTVDDGAGGGCTAPVGAGQCSYVAGAPGPRSVTASYEGDANFLPSQTDEPFGLEIIQPISDIPTLWHGALALFAALLAGAALRMLRAR